MKPLAAVILGALVLPAQANEFTGLGFLGTGSWSGASGVSADGSVVVGASDNGSTWEAFRWTAATDLRLGAEAAHRFDDSTGGVNGQVIGLWNFSLPGQKVKQTWARATLDVDHRLSNTVALTFGANAASNGGDANWSVTAGLRMNF